MPSARSHRRSRRRTYYNAYGQRRKEGRLECLIRNLLKPFKYVLEGLEEFLFFLIDGLSRVLSPIPSGYVIITLLFAILIVVSR